jgi:hypothetical protein
MRGLKLANQTKPACQLGESDTKSVDQTACSPAPKLPSKGPLQHQT